MRTIFRAEGTLNQAVPVAMPAARSVEPTPVEKAPSAELFAHTLHPYTKALLSAIPSTDILHPMKRLPLKGEITSPINPKPGCRFYSRCPYAAEACRQPQELTEVSGRHFVSCCRVSEING